MAAVTLWQLGYPDQALEKTRESINLAQQLNFPYSLSLTLQRAALLSQLRGEVQATREHAEALIAFAHEQGFPLHEARGLAARGWALAKLGRQEEGIVQIREGLKTAQKAEDVLYLPGLLAVLASAYCEAGQAEEGLEALTQAFDLTSRTGCAINEPSLYLCKGVLLLLKAEFDDAESCFRRAIEAARKRCARLPELRATTSLARLLRDSGRRDEARGMLAEIYNWFTEGFDTADLKEAQALLEELNR
jgi:predicted ATPase